MSVDWEVGLTPLVSEVVASAVVVFAEVSVVVPVYCKVYAEPWVDV